MWIDRLVEVTHWEPRQGDMSWGDTEERLALSLPEDYKRLAAVFGKGLFSDFLQILSVAPGGAFDLANTWRGLSADAPAEAHDPLYAPYRIYQSGQVGLIPWGFSQAEGEYHWLANGKGAEEWPIVTRGRGYREWRQLDMSTPEFIYRVVADPEFEPFSIAALVPEPFFAPAPSTDWQTTC
ncbi:hypothetical protein [Streptomyces sp. NPDC050287]|uniref:hypothetical protein n=1 Tax=Streptomyces sp. NPDC050287 TaxID=3365608 RepID=UPI0037BAC3A5